MAGVQQLLERRDCCEEAALGCRVLDERRPRSTPLERADMANDPQRLPALTCY